MTFQYSNATIIIFYFIINLLSISLSHSLPVIKQGHFRSIYDNEHPCQQCNPILSYPAPQPTGNSCREPPRPPALSTHSRSIKSVYFKVLSTIHLRKLVVVVSVAWLQGLVHGEEGQEKGLEEDEESGGE